MGSSDQKWPKVTVSHEKFLSSLWPPELKKALPLYPQYSSGRVQRFEASLELAAIGKAGTLCRTLPAHHAPSPFSPHAYSSLFCFSNSGSQVYWRAVCCKEEKKKEARRSAGCCCGAHSRQSTALANAKLRAEARTLAGLVCDYRVGDDDDELRPKR